MSMAREYGKLEYHHEQLVEAVIRLVPKFRDHVNKYIEETDIDDYDLEMAIEEANRLMEKVGEHGKANIRQKTA